MGDDDRREEEGAGGGDDDRRAPSRKDGLGLYLFGRISQTGSVQFEPPVPSGSISIQTTQSNYSTGSISISIRHNTLKKPNLINKSICNS